jgi:MFS superfamily sulfate permease-like transporter
MSFTETIAAGRAFVAGDEPSPRPNVELLATGVANVAGAFFGAMPGGGGTSQTAVNRTTGAKTQIAGIVTALMALMTMLFLSPLIGLMPQATLAAVVIVYSIGLIQPVDFRAILRIRRTEFVWAIAAFVGVMLLGTLKGILVSIIVSLVALMHQAANPQVYSLVRKRGTNVFRPRSEEHADDESFPGLLVLRPEGRLFFVNMERVMDKMRPLVTDANPEVVVLDLSAVFDLEYTALKALTTAEQRLRDRGVSMWVAGLTPDVFAMVRRSPLGDVLGDQRMLFNVEVAVARFLASRRDNARIEM